MEKYKKHIIILVVAIILIALISIIIINNKSEKNNDGKLKIVTSFYPMYILTANITQGANNIELVNMADTNVGCVHNYTLTTSDMKKLEAADVFIQNGLELENFADKIISKNKDIQIIDSSKDITNIIKNDDEVNPHIWTSINNYIKQVENVYNQLKDINPENEQIYKKNADEYIQKLTQLKQAYDMQAQKLEGQTAISLNESFEYLAKDLKLNLKTIHTNHEESTVSAETLKNIIEEMKNNQTKIIIVDINDDIKNAQTIANETGAKIYKLDSCLTGNLSKDSYINSMTGNLSCWGQK